MMSEEEAKTRWCPFAMALRGDGAAVNRDTVLMTGDVDCRCLASGCMAWRWGEILGQPTLGFCGLAGEPR